MSVLILSLLTVFFSSGSGQSSPSFITYVLTPKGLEEPSILPCSKSALQKGDALSPPCCFPGDTVRIPKPVPSFELHSVFGFRR